MKPRPNRVWLGFRIGLLAGLAALFAVLAASRLPPAPSAARYVAEVRTSGQKLTDQGVRSVRPRDAYESIVQTCHNACDDLRVRDNDVLYGGYHVEMFDQRGQCLFCRWEPGAVADDRRVEAMARGAATMVTRPES